MLDSIGDTAYAAIMETTITTSPLLAASFAALLIIIVATIALIAIIIAKGNTWRETTQVRTLRAAIALTVLSVALMVSNIAIESNQVGAAVDALESEHGIAQVVPLTERTVSGCSLSGFASAAEYTWVSADGERERGIFSKTARQDGSCVYSLTPESTS